MKKSVDVCQPETQSSRGAEQQQEQQQEEEKKIATTEEDKDKDKDKEEAIHDITECQNDSTENVHQAGAEETVAQGSGKSSSSKRHLKAVDCIS